MLQVMFLIQERLLKRQKIGPLFRHLPPISYLANAISRLFLIGLIFLSVGIAAAYGMTTQPTGLKLTLSYAVLILYALLYSLQIMRRLSPRPIAWIAVLGFSLPLVTLWVISNR